MDLCPLGEVSGRMRGGGVHGNKSQAGVGGRDTKDTGEKGGGRIWCPTG